MAGNLCTSLNDVRHIPCAIIWTIVARLAAPCRSSTGIKRTENNGQKYFIITTFQKRRQGVRPRGEQSLSVQQGALQPISRNARINSRVRMSKNSPTHKDTGHYKLVIVKDQSSHLLFLNIYIITNLWKFELNWLSKVRDNNERKNILVLCAFRCLFSRPQILNLKSRNKIRGK